jgi:hypothetical protein
MTIKVFENGELTDRDSLFEAPTRYEILRRVIDKPRMSDDREPIITNKHILATLSSNDPSSGRFVSPVSESVEELINGAPGTLDPERFFGTYESLQPNQVVVLPDSFSRGEQDLDHTTHSLSAFLPLTTDALIRRLRETHGLSEKGCINEHLTPENIFKNAIGYHAERLKGAKLLESKLAGFYWRGTKGRDQRARLYKPHESMDAIGIMGYANLNEWLTKISTYRTELSEGKKNLDTTKDILTENEKSFRANTIRIAESNIGLFKLRGYAQAMRERPNDLIEVMSIDTCNGSARVRVLSRSKPNLPHTIGYRGLQTTGQNPQFNNRWVNFSSYAMQGGDESPEQRFYSNRRLQRGTPIEEMLLTAQVIAGYYAVRRQLRNDKYREIVNSCIPVVTSDAMTLYDKIRDQTVIIKRKNTVAWQVCPTNDTSRTELFFKALLYYGMPKFATLEPRNLGYDPGMAAVGLKRTQ